jgi:methionyl aminopeptidase
MIHIKDNIAIQKMAQAGKRISELLEEVTSIIAPGVSTAAIDEWIDKKLQEKKLVSSTKGYMGYKHASCIAVNDEVVHGVPRVTCILKAGDVVKIDVCASWDGYCADMARSFFVGESSEEAKKLVDVAKRALDKGIEKARVGNKLSDISAAIQEEVEKHGFGVVRDFAGHGIGKNMHEEPEILNYGKAGRGPVLKEGMTFAIEPMITLGNYATYIASDGWTVKTVDGSLAAHVEDTIAITKGDPMILTRSNAEQHNNVSFS